MLTLFLVLSFAAQEPPPFEGDHLAAPLREAQSGNAAATREGRLRGRVEIETDNPEQPIRAKVEITWRDEDYALRLELDDPIGHYFGARDAAGAIIRDQICYYWRSDDRLLCFTPLNAFATVSPYGYDRHWDFLMQPAHLWNVSGSRGQGRPWPEMVGYIPDRPGYSKSVELKKLDNGLIRQTRRDTAGGVLEIDFSPEFSGLPVSQRYIQPDGTSFGATYQWEQREDRTILRSCRIQPQPLRRGAIPLREFRYFLDEVDFDAVDPERFTLERFLASLPPGTKVEDRTRPEELRRPPIIPPPLPPGARPLRHR